MAVTYVGAGTKAVGTGNVTPTLPTGWAQDDIFILAVESANQTVSAPAGWTAVTNSPQGTGTAGGTTSTAMSLFWKRATSSESNPTVTDPGDHAYAVIRAYRGAVLTGDPFNTTAGSVASTASTTVTMPSVTTTVNDTMIVWYVSNSTDSNTGQGSGTWTNAALTGITDAGGDNTNSGNGGGLATGYGFKATAGSTGTTASSISTSSVQGRITLAITPYVANDPPTVVLNTGLGVYYVDGHTSISDTDSRWSNDINAFNGDLTTFASSSYISVNELIAVGTNAPSSGANISQVRIRFYGYASADGSGSASWSSYSTLSVPSGGWSWTAVNSLEVRASHFSPLNSQSRVDVDAYVGGIKIGTATRTSVASSSNQTSYIAKIEVEVVTEVIFDSPTPVLAFTGTDAQSDEIEYNVQVDRNATFDSVAGPSPTVKEAFEIDSNAYNAVYGGTANNSEAQAQSFLANSTFYATTISLKMYKFGTVTDNLYIELVSTSITGTVIATSNLLAPGAILNGYYTDFTFASPPLLTSGTTYYFRIFRTGGNDTTNFVGIYVNNASGYADGSTFVRSSGSWTSSSTIDIRFAIYGTTSLSAPLLNKLSITPDAGFSGTGDPHPWPSGNQVTYTIQSGNALTNSTTYYWRVRAKDPTGSNTYGAWSEIRSFTVSTGGGGGSTGQIKFYNGSSFVAKPVKVWTGSAWVTKPMKRWNGSSWITTPY